MECTECKSKISSVNKMTGAEFARMLIERTSYVTCKNCYSQTYMPVDEIIGRLGRLIDKLEGM